VVYTEACESGSIFDGMLPNNTNIFVTTAANGRESSWGCYCPGQIPPPPHEYTTCLGDKYRCVSESVELPCESCWCVPTHGRAVSRSTQLGVLATDLNIPRRGRLSEVCGERRSVSWMEDAERLRRDSAETLEQAYELVKNETQPQVCPLALTSTRPPPPDDTRVSWCANTPSWVLRDTAQPCVGTPPAVATQLHFPSLTRDVPPLPSRWCRGASSRAAT
jgi:hypothetical protein